MGYLGEEGEKRLFLSKGADIENIEGKRATHRNPKLPYLIQANAQFLLHNGSPLDSRLVPARGNLAAKKQMP